MSIDEFFAGSPERERPIFEAVRAHLDDLGPVVVEPVSVGILFKAGPVFAELRPRKRWVALSFTLPVKQASHRLARKVIPTSASQQRWYHVVNLTEAAQVDAEIRDWLTEAYLDASER
jgi:hypothetical protein